MYEIGKKYEIDGFADECPDAFVNRLLSMGFIPGNTFQIKRVAPLSDPIQIEIKDTCVSLRKSELCLMEATEL